MQNVREWHDVDQEAFQEEIIPLNKPAVFKSLVRDWPAVQQSTSSPAAMTSYLSLLYIQRFTDVRRRVSI